MPDSRQAAYEYLRGRLESANSTDPVHAFRDA